MGVVEGHSSASGLTEHQITQCLVRPFRQRFGPFQNGLLLLRQHAVQTAHDGQWQNDPAILGLLVSAPQQVSDRPDEGFFWGTCSSAGCTPHHFEARQQDMES